MEIRIFRIVRNQGFLTPLQSTEGFHRHRKLSKSECRFSAEIMQNPNSNNQTKTYQLAL